MVRNHLEQVSSGVLALANCVSTIWVGKHRERFVMLDQLVDQKLRCLVMAVIIACPVDQEKFTLKLVRKGDGRAQAVAFRIVARQAHVSLLIDGVIVELIGHRCN